MNGEDKEPLLGNERETNPESSRGAHYDSFPNGRSSLSESDYEANGKGEKNGDGKEDIQVYKRRWYMIVVYGLFALTQNGVWNTWGPISTTANEAFGWDTAVIALMSNWGPISYIIVGFFFPWLLQVKGLRWAVLSSMLICAVGVTLRVFTSEPGPATILIHIGQFFNGVAGPMAMGAIPQLSSDWFPPHERVTATALGASIACSGLAISFVLGPALVKGGPPDNTTISTTTAATTVGGELHQYSMLYEPANVTEARIHQERHDIMQYMYYECGWAWFLTILMLIYFPSKPPKPPSSSANIKRDPYWSGLWALRTKGSFLIISSIYGVSLGVLNCWQSVLNSNLHTVNVSEDEAGWIGFYSTIAAAVSGMLIGKFAEYFTRSMKILILVLYSIGTGCFIVFALMLIGVIPFSDIILYGTIIGGCALLNGAVPLMFELACELAYPTSESAANGFLTYLNNVGGLIFLGVFAFPGIGTMWMNWALIGSTFVCVPLVGMLKGRMNRLDMDEGKHQVEQEVDVPQATVQNAYSVQGDGAYNA